MDETCKCAYCGKVRPVSEMEQGTIIFQNSKYDPVRGKWKKFVDRKTNWYCRAKDAQGLNCHSKDQFAHEG